MNVLDIILIIVIAAVVIGAIKLYRWRGKNSSCCGSSSSCSGNCCSCNMNCEHHKK